MKLNKDFIKYLKRRQAIKLIITGVLLILGILFIPKITCVLIAIAVISGVIK